MAVEVDYTLKESFITYKELGAAGLFMKDYLQSKFIGNSQIKFNHKRFEAETGVSVYHQKKALARLWMQGFIIIPPEYMEDDYPTQWGVLIDGRKKVEERQG